MIPDSLTPMLIPVIAVLCVLLLDGPQVPKRFSAWIALASLVTAVVLTFMIRASGRTEVALGMFSQGGTSVLLSLFFCAAGGVTILLSLGHPDTPGPLDGGGYALVLLAVLGAWIATQATHMLPRIIGLAMLYISSAGIVGPGAARRYVVIHGVSLAILLYGIALLYGAAGTLRIDAIAERAHRDAIYGLANPLMTLGAGVIAGGLSLSAGLVPFHAWLYDTYRTMRLPGGLFVSLALPGAVIMAWGPSFAWLGSSPLLPCVLGCCSAVIGYGYALYSRLVKETIASLAVAQSGILLLALAVVPAASRGSLFYILAGGTASLCCLWVLVVHTQRQDGHPLSLGELAGLGRRHPWIASVVTFALLNLAAAPPLAGWVGQLYLARAAAAAGYGWVIAPLALWTFLAWLLVGRWLPILWLRPLQDRPQTDVTPEVAVVGLAAASSLFVAGVQAEAILSWLITLGSSL